MSEPAASDSMHPTAADNRHNHLCSRCGNELTSEPDDSSPTWSHPSEMWRVIVHPAHLMRTVATSLVVGTVLFCINHLAAVVTGDATALVWIESAVTYLVPFVVSNIGLLIGTRRSPSTA